MTAISGKSSGEHHPEAVPERAEYCPESRVAGEIVRAFVDAFEA